MSAVDQLLRFLLKSSPRVAGSDDGCGFHRGREMRGAWDQASAGLQGRPLSCDTSPGWRVGWARAATSPPMSPLDEP